MQSIITSLLIWPLVVHALVNGEYQDAILDVYDSKKQCDKIKEEQHIAGECYEITSVTNRKTI